MEYLKKNSGVISIWFLVLFPVFVWFFDTSFYIRTESVTNILQALGQVTGIVGMVLFAVNLILASRLKFFDKIFFGINKMYAYHHMLGGIAFSFLLFHPTFLVLQYASISFDAVRLFFAPSVEKAPVIFGVVSLWVMIFALVATFYMHLKYQVWKGIHKFLGLAFFLGGIHAFLIPSTISNNAVLKYYMLALSIFALGSAVYRSVLYKILVPTYKYTVREVKKINDVVFEIVLSPNSKRLSFVPGQFAFISFDSKKVKSESHPFSMTSNPANDTLSFVVKDLGDYTKSLPYLLPGDVASVEGPFGVFSSHKVSNRKQIWIAGGIGVTPFLSMARSLDLEDNIELIYLIRSENEVVYGDELALISSKNKNFKVTFWYSEKRGHITADGIKEIVSDIINRDVFICGPVSLMRELILQFKKIGIDDKMIHTEKFGFD